MKKEININDLIKVIEPAIVQIVRRNVSDEKIFQIIGEKVLAEVEKTIKETISEVVIDVLKSKLKKKK